MAEPSSGRRARLRPGPLAVALALAAWSVAPSSRADWKVTPRVELSETYTDNVLLQPREQAQAQFVSDLRPAVALAYEGPRLRLTGAYSKSFRKYSDQDLPGTQGGNQQLQANASVKLYEEALLLESSASISQVANSAFGPQVPNNGGFVDGLGSEVKTFHISPSFRHRFGSFARLNASYAHDRVLSDNRGLGQTNSDILSVVLAAGPSFSTLGWNLAYQSNRFDNKALQLANTTPQSNSKNLSAGLQYAVQPGLRLLLNGGYEKYDYETVPGAAEPSGKSWSAGLAWNPSGRTSVQATAGKRYFGNSYSLAASHRGRASVWTLNYSESVTTTQGQFLQTGSLSTAAMLDQLFAGTIQDPVLRRRVVEAYILANNLPPSLANSTNYFSNRFMLQKQLQAAGGWVGSRGTLLVSVTDARRVGLSSLRVDSDLLGSSNSLLNDNTRQSSASVSFNWRLSSLTAATAGTTFNKARSLSIDRTDTNLGINLGLSHDFARELRGSLQLRRVRGDVLAGNSTYTENALSASLSKQF